MASKYQTMLKEKKKTYISSYAHAESLSIEPFDSMIGTVVNPNKKPIEILGFEKGHTFSSSDDEKYVNKANKIFVAMPKGMEYTEDAIVEIYADSADTAKMILRQNYTGKWEVYEKNIGYKKM